MDILARESATGFLWLYPGNGAGAFLPRVRVGTGWNAFNALVGPGDMNGDGATDVLAREAATGILWKGGHVRVDNGRPRGDREYRGAFPLQRFIGLGGRRRGGLDFGNERRAVFVAVVVRVS